MILIALLLAIVSVGAVFAAANDTDVSNGTDSEDTDVPEVPVANETVDNETADDSSAGGEATTNTTNTTGNVTNDTNISAAGEPVKAPVENTLAETGLPIVALVLVVLAAVGVYRRK